MSEHIRRLEEALEGTSSPSNPHPLLQPDMLNVKSTMQLYGVAQPKHDGSSIPVSAERTIDHDLNSDIEPNWTDAMSSVAAVCLLVSSLSLSITICRANDVTIEWKPRFSV